MDSENLEKDSILNAWKGKCTSDYNMPDFSKDPTVLKRAAEASEMIRKYGLPKELGPLVNVKPGPEWDDAF